MDATTSLVTITKELLQKGKKNAVVIVNFLMLNLIFLNCLCTFLSTSSTF